jgi:hypothetical protein
MNVIVYGLNCVPSVALSSAAFNPSWHLTAVSSSRSFGAKADGAGRSAVAVHVASRRWLSFLR